MSNICEEKMELPAEHERNVFGQFDEHIKKIEKTLGVTVISRNGQLRILGPMTACQQAVKIIREFLALSQKGNTITQQNVNYALALAAEEKTSVITEIDKECICHTLNGRPIKPKTLGQKAYIDAIRKKMIVFGLGPAGTGKTYLAMAMAITAFKNDEVGRIILTRPAIEAGEKLGFLPGDLQSKIDPYLRPLYDALYEIMGAESFAKNILTRPAIEAGEKLGFLPGDLQSKIDPYLRPLYDALYEIMGAESFAKNMEKGLIEVAPLAYMRGRTLDNAFIILDEAQNTTPAQMKMFLTRIGFGSKVIVTGDLSQKDLPSGTKSGLDVALHVLKKVEDIAFCELTNKDVVRHPLVQKIVQAYDAYEKKEANEKREKKPRKDRRKER